MFLQILIHFVSPPLSFSPPRVCVCLYLHTILYIYIHTHKHTHTHAHKGGSVEIGEMLINKDGSIDSDQMKQFTDTLAKMEDGLAKATVNIEVLTADNLALKTDSAALKADNVVLKADNVALKTDSATLKADNGALKARVFDLETAAAANTGSSSGASSSELVAVKADLATLAANHTTDMAALSETFSKGIVELEDHLVEVNTSLTTTMSNVVYADGVHPGGSLDFTEGSASLVILKQTLPGVKVFLSPIEIKGSNIKGSVISELLKDAAVVGGDLRCYNNDVRFAADDDELVFASLTEVRDILMKNNHNAVDSAGRYTSPSSVSFPALEFVPGAVELQGNRYRLKTISMPKLVGVGGVAQFYGNDVLTSLQLPSLLNVGSTFHLGDLPKLTTGGVHVSQQFNSCGRFSADAVGFTCTTDNGLKAVVQGAASTQNENVASCKK